MIAKGKNGQRDVLISISDTHGPRSTDVRSKLLMSAYLPIPDTRGADRGGYPLRRSLARLPATLGFRLAARLMYRRDTPSRRAISDAAF
jgi:hypothetical protein